MKDNITYGLIGLLAGILLTWIFASLAVNNQNYGMMGTRNMMNNADTSNNQNMMGGDMSDAMQGMMNGIYNKTGDEFDQAFISGMIVHHQGAINMAKAALNNSERQEIKNLANAIISAQTKEIEQMKQWQNDWFK